MKKILTRIGLVLFGAMLPMLMAPSGGYPSQPTFQSAVVVGNIQFGSASTAGTISGGNFNGQTVTGSTAVNGGTISGTTGNFSGTVNISPATGVVGMTVTATGVTTAIRGIATTAASNSFVASAGSLSGVAYSFDTNSTVGIYQSAANNIDFGILGTNAGNISNTRNWTIPAPSSGTALSVTGVSGANTNSILAIAAPIQVNNNLLPLVALNAVGANFGLIQNTSSASWALGYGTALNALGTSILTWTAAGGVQIGAPTGGDQGTGTINAVKLFQNGVQVPKYAAATLQGTVGGCTIGAQTTNINVASCSRTSAGVYVVTYTNAFANTPTCSLTPVGASGVGIEYPSINTQSGSSFTTANVLYTSIVVFSASDYFFYMVCVGV